jgi:cold shock CspA family protein
MAVRGTVSFYNPQEDWGLIRCHGREVFVHGKQCDGRVLAIGQAVQFVMGEKGSNAEDVVFLGSAREAVYHGVLQPRIGAGIDCCFIVCEAFPGEDIFVLMTDIPGGCIPHELERTCTFKVTQKEESKLWKAHDVTLPCLSSSSASSGTTMSRDAAPATTTTTNTQTPRLITTVAEDHEETASNGSSLGEWELLA